MSSKSLRYTPAKISSHVAEKLHDWTMRTREQTRYGMQSESLVETEIARIMYKSSVRKRLNLPKVCFFNSSDSSFSACSCIRYPNIRTRKRGDRESRDGARREEALWTKNRQNANEQSETILTDHTLQNGLKSDHTLLT